MQFLGNTCRIQGIRWGVSLSSLHKCTWGVWDEGGGEGDGDERDRVFRMTACVSATSRVAPPPPPPIYLSEMQGNVQLKSSGSTKEQESTRVEELGAGIAQY